MDLSAFQGHSTGTTQAITCAVMLPVNTAELPSLSREGSYWWGPCSGWLWHEVLGRGGFLGLSPAGWAARAALSGVAGLATFLLTSAFLLPDCQGLFS